MALIRHQYLRQLPALLAVAAVVAVLAVAVPRYLPYMAMVENWVADMRIAFLTPGEPQHPDIVILEITEDTLADLPYRSPVDRAFLAALLEKLAGAGVRAVGLDILLDRATEPEKDERLRHIMATYPVHLIAAWWTMDLGLTESQAEYLREFLPMESRGLAFLRPDRYDTTVRRLYPGHEGAGEWAPALAWALSDALGADPHKEATPIAWRGMPEDGNAPFASYPAHAAGFLPDAWFADKIVLIGANQPDSDRHRTPLHRRSRIPEVYNARHTDPRSRPGPVSRRTIPCQCLPRPRDRHRARGGGRERTCGAPRRARRRRARWAHGPSGPLLGGRVRALRRGRPAHPARHTERGAGCRIRCR